MNTSTSTAANMTVLQAAAQARRYPHGSRLSDDAVSRLCVLYAAAKGRHPELDRPDRPGSSYLDPLWGWVREYETAYAAGYAAGQKDAAAATAATIAKWGFA